MIVKGHSLGLSKKEEEKPQIINILPMATDTSVNTNGFSAINTESQDALAFAYQVTCSLTHLNFHFAHHA
jgi:hypothetical protein